MNTTRYYLDSSVYLGILLGEPAARHAAKTISHKTLCSSTLLLIESERNLVRMSREKILTAENFSRAIEQIKKDKEVFLLKEVTMDLCLTGEFPPVRIPRSNDLTHLRTALWFQRNGGLGGFLTFDQTQEEVAQELGLPVISIKK